MWKLYNIRTSALSGDLMMKNSNGVILKIRVKPKSRQFKILPGEELIVFCRETPYRGKVNKELIQEITKFFGKEVILISGFTSKNKKLLIKDIKKNEVNERLGTESVWNSVKERRWFVWEINLECYFKY